MGPRRLRDWKIKTKIMAGFGCVIVLLLIVSVVSALGLFSGDRSLSEYRAAADIVRRVAVPISDERGLR